MRSFQVTIPKNTGCIKDSRSPPLPKPPKVSHSSLKIAGFGTFRGFFQKFVKKPSHDSSSPFLFTLPRCSQSWVCSPLVQEWQAQKSRRHSLAKILSDARHFVPWHGTSANLNIAKSKAELESRKALAQQVETNLQVVTDNYAQEMVGNQASKPSNDSKRWPEKSRPPPLEISVRWEKTSVSWKTRPT